MKKLMRWQTGNVFAIQQHGARCGLMHTGNDIEQRRLASTIGTDQAGNGPFFYRQRCVINSREAAKLFGQIIYLDHGFAVVERELSWLEKRALNELTALYLSLRPA